MEKVFMNKGIGYYTQAEKRRKVDSFIYALGKKAIYFDTRVENEDGEWNDRGLSYKDGFAVIHNGKYHDVYKFE